ncbi:SbcC/MukB-like Walker B domain-containing protein [Dyella amyloliquefaciens]|uniref:SbcC/MukB-like Walker B domain-containing protein n=1 Tax=Dyella amyloliquefaciens TaxID=1770545 RepID=UPI0013EEA27A|nr:SbcC/MukB-like Walker B domain-containing protein [Dyella amyloliquefaciens]
MKHLEAIGLVQYFLYERIDLRVGRNTAFLGPNGTGKTALLDALQIVLLAADANMMNFNAAGEGKKRARTLREYCLGVYGQTDDERARSAANTYINLVFRDPETQIPVTVGVSASASTDSLDVIRNLYILPGVALTTASHIEKEGGREAVIPWRRFMHVAADLCRQEGATPFFTTNGSDFARRLYLEHLASPGEKPNVRSIRSSFARSLKLNKDVEDLDETLRQHLIEARPINVRQFRARLDQFREVTALIRRITARIESARRVEDRYAVVHRERTAQTNLLALKAVYESERVAEKLGETEELLETYREQLEAAGLALARATDDRVKADAARIRAVEALNRDPEYTSQAGQADRLKDQQERLSSVEKQLTVTLDALLALLGQAGRIPALLDHQGEFEEAFAVVDDLKRALKTAHRPEPTVLLAAGRAAARVHDVVRKALYAAEADARQAKERRRDAKTALERAQCGLSPLRPQVVMLQRVLEDAGIQTTPVCDVVSIKDPKWQPAIEGYLATNVEALLVPADKELEAIDAYKGLKGSQAIYGVKLALPSRGKPWQAPGGGRYAAQLIDGENNAAVRYLQGELGRLALAESSHDLQIGARAISVEGMLSTGGGIERLRLPAASDMKIGRAQEGNLRAQAEQEVRDAEGALKAAEEAASQLQAVHSRLAQFADGDGTQVMLEGQFASLAESRALVGDLSSALVASQSDRLTALRAAMNEAGAKLEAAMVAERTHGQEAARFDTMIQSTEKERATLEKLLTLANQAEAGNRQKPMYDAKQVNTYRERYDGRFGDDWDAKLEACSTLADKAGATALNADREGWQLFCQYVADNDIRNHDVANAQWERAYAYVMADRQRLEELELVEQMARAEEAYAAAVKVFRTDVAQAILEGFDAVEEQIDSLNQVLRHAPEFSNGERYQFRYKVVPQHQALYDFLKRVREHGDVEEDMFGGSGKVPEEFRALVDGSADSELLHDTSPLNDHRRFFSYDVEIFRESKSVGWLSKRLGPGSGGEHRTPLYVIFGAALAAAYGKARGTEGSGGVMMLDEAFEKMDPQNVRATAEYLNSLGLQLVMAGPEGEQSKMSSFLDIYYDMARYGSRTVQMTMNLVEEAARELLRSDNFMLHPELLEQKIQDIEANRRAAG